MIHRAGLEYAHWCGAKIAATWLLDQASQPTLDGLRMEAEFHRLCWMRIGVGKLTSGGVSRRPKGLRQGFRMALVLHGGRVGRRVVNTVAKIRRAIVQGKTHLRRCVS